MKKITLIKISLIFIFFVSGIICAQVERETRAVWLTTNFRLDWPPQRYNADVQKAALTEIFDDIRRKNFNTVYFQVRFNGTVLFKSSYEPMSYYITGKLGDTTAYDPLQFAIELAHKRGLEIHAWVNLIKCYDSSEKILFDSPLHICQMHPDWIIKDSQDGGVSYWLDPGLPAVRSYLTNLVAELVENYDIDGIHYDYLRYPGKNFDDDFSYGVHGGGLSKDDWRRNNLTELVRSLSEETKALKPTLKTGVAPIGIYKNLPNARGLEGYNDTYQDSREWLRLKYIDYVVPQIYWGFEGNPKFDVVAKDWNENSFGRNVILGIGAYKTDIYADIDKMIDFSRQIKAAGVSFFRYKNIKNYDFDLFANKAFPSMMPWLDGSKPNSPTNLNYEFVPGKTGFISLSWKFPQATKTEDSLRYFSLYSLPEKNSKATNEDLFEIISAERNSVTLGIKRPKKIDYFFTLKSVTKLWNESNNNSNVIKVTFPELNSLAVMDSFGDAPVLIKSKDETPKIMLFIPVKEKLVFYSAENGIVRKFAEREVEAGKNVISITSNISGSEYLIIKYANSGREINLML